MTVQHASEAFLDGFERILADAAATGRRLTRDEIDSRRVLGARAAEAGHGWRTLIRAHLAAGRGGWPPQADPDSVLAVIEQAVDAFADGYERAQRLVVRKEEAARREFIDDLLHGRGDAGQLAARSERFGLRLSRAHAVAVAAGPEPYDETDPVPRQVAGELFARFENRRILFTTKDGRMVCIAPGDQDDVLTHFAKQAYAATGNSQVAIGRSRPGTVGIGHSYEEALNALDVAQRMGLDEPLLRAADLLVFPVLARDRQALVDLVHSTLGSLDKAGGGARPLLDTLTAYFDTGCVAAETARRLSLSVRALTYRLERIHTLTGNEPHRSRPPLHPADRGHRRPPARLAHQTPALSGPLPVETGPVEGMVGADTLRVVGRSDHKRTRGDSDLCRITAMKSVCALVKTGPGMPTPQHKERQ